MNNPEQKYRPFPVIDMPNRQWPNKTIDKAPLWCSVDLRDGNQALIEPMGPERKMRMFQLLLEVGFKEIEVGFPAASQTDFDFVRQIVEEDLIPDGVTVQVLVQARRSLIERTFEALKGCKRAIVHVYNSTSRVQREVVFRQDRAGIAEIAVQGATWVKECADKQPDTQWQFEYSPESFTGTELDYALEVCNKVLKVWQPTPEHKAIINLPATVEVSTPNIYADQIEWMCDRIDRRDSVLISVHPHNDRGCAVAAAELAQMAGADRVEGTLFGNGERTGNVDLVTLGMNLYTQGVNPELNFDDIFNVMRTAEYCNQLPVHPRHPYAGELVFTAFSGSHQDAIKKGMALREDGSQKNWEVPYLPIDPADLGRSYEAVIRVNSQSGKGGVAFIMEQDYGIKMPRRLQIEFSQVVQALSEQTGGEVDSNTIWGSFNESFLNIASPLQFVSHLTTPVESGPESQRHLSAETVFLGEQVRIEGEGNGPIDAYIHAISTAFAVECRVVDYHQHATASNSDAQSACYVELQTSGSNDTVYGVGLHENIVTASLLAVTSAVNRACSLDFIRLKNS